MLPFLTLFNYRPSYQNHNEEIVNHLYHAGFQTGVSFRFLTSSQCFLMTRAQNYSDTILVSVRSAETKRIKPTQSLQHVHQNVYRLHAIILSRSPFLAHLMSTSPQNGGQRVIYVHLDQEPEVTQEVCVDTSSLLRPYF